MQEYSEHPLNRKFDIDTLFATLWEFYKKWFPSLFAISFILSLITAYLSARIDFSAMMGETDPYVIMESFKLMIGPSLLILLFSLIATMIIQYWIIRKPVDPGGNIVSYTGTVLVKFFLPLLVLFIIFGIFSIFAIMAGLVVFIIGVLFSMVYILLLFALVSPVIMIEQNGIGSALTRTFALAHKRFWPNIGWTTVFILIIMVISIILGAIIMIPFGGGFIRTIINPDAIGELMDFTRRPSFIILTALTNAVTMPLMPIFGVALYFNARKYDEDAAGTVITSDGLTVDDLTP